MLSGEPGGRRLGKPTASHAPKQSTKHDAASLNDVLGGQTRLGPYDPGGGDTTRSDPVSGQARLCVGTGIVGRLTMCSRQPTSSSRAGADIRLEGCNQRERKEPTVRPRGGRWDPKVDYPEVIDSPTRDG